MTGDFDASAGIDGLDAMFRPGAVAVVGATQRPGSLGAAMLDSLSHYPHGVAKVNRRSPRPEAGFHGSVAEASHALGTAIDLAILCVPASVCAAELHSSAEAGVRRAVICAGGFEETGTEHHREVLQTANRFGIRILGPNTSGFIAPHHRLTASFVPAASRVRAGNVAIVSSSGGINHMVALMLTNAGVGISLAVGVGGGIDIGHADILEYLETDERTTVVALHIESTRDGRRLIEAVRALTPRAAVVALVVGRSDIDDFARSHTGALNTSWHITTSALREAGAVLVRDEEELVAAVAALSTARLAPKAHPGVAVVTAQAGPGLVLLDDLEQGGVSVPELSATTQLTLSSLLAPMTFQRNPVDTGRPGATFGRVVDAVGSDPGVDLIAAYALHEPGSLDLDSIGRPSVPLIFGLGGLDDETAHLITRLRDGGHAATSSPTRVAQASRALVDDAKARARALAEDPRPVRSAAPPPMRPAGDWDEAHAKAFLTVTGIRHPTSRRCATRAEAYAALDELAAPLAVKVLTPVFIHKAEVRGVHLDVRTRADLDRALDTLEGIGATSCLVEEMAADGHELILSATCDAVFGPLVVVGAGGAHAEMWSDVSTRLAPTTTRTALEMIEELKCRPMLDQGRGGRPRADLDALAEIIVRLSELISDSGAIHEIEINPLRWCPEGWTALDAVITDRHDDTGVQE